MERTGASTRLSFCVLVFVAELVVEIEFAGGFLFASSTRVCPGKPVVNAIVPRQQLDCAFQILNSIGHIARRNVCHAQVERRIWEGRIFNNRGEPPNGGYII